MQKSNKKTGSKEATNKEVLLAIDDLARMAARGFAETAENLKEVKKDVSAIRIDLNSVKHEVGEIKQVLGPLVQIVNGQNRDIRDLKNRVTHLEKLAGVDR